LRLEEEPDAPLGKRGIITTELQVGLQMRSWPLNRYELNMCAAAGPVAPQFQLLNTTYVDPSSDA